MTFVAALLASFVTILFMLALRPVADALGLVDRPGGRKRHDVPVPVIGGICMCVGLGFGSSLIERPDFWPPMVLAICLVVVVGVIDDRFDLPPSVRLFAQTCACLLVVFGGRILVEDLGSAFFFGLRLGVFAPVFSILFILTVINAFNVIDGIDGLAGGLAVISLAGLGIVGFGTDTFPSVLVLFAVVAAYLIFNLPVGLNASVRTFMGDAGSTLLGLAIACIGIVLSQGEGAPMSPAAGLWLIAVPAFDFFSVITRRVILRRFPWAPHHDHLHHVLIEKGLSKRVTLVFMLSAAAIFAVIGILGSTLRVPDSAMCLGWIGAGALYYQTMRRPGLVVRLMKAQSSGVPSSLIESA